MLEFALSLLRLSVAEHMRTAARRMGVALLYATIASVAAASALGCIITAIWLALLPAIGPIWTPLAIGGTLALVSAGFILALCKRSERHSESAGGASSSPDLSALLRDHKTALLLGAAVAGIVAGSDRRRRQR